MVKAAPGIKMEEDELSVSLEDFINPSRAKEVGTAVIASHQAGISEERPEHRKQHICSSKTDKDLLKKIAEMDNTIDMLREQVRRARRSGPILRSSHLQGPTLNEYEKQKRQIRQLQDELVQKSTENDQLWDQIVQFEDLEDAYDMVVKKAELLEKQNDAVVQANHAEVKQLRQYIKSLQGQSKELNKQLIALEAMKGKGHKIANSSKVSDDEIKSLWRTMAYNIQNIATTILTGIPSQKELKHGHDEPSCAICHMDSGHAAILHNEDFGPCVIEHYIWRAVVRKIFGRDENGSHSSSWAGVAGESMGVIYTKLLEVVNREEGDPSEVMQWKSETATIIDEMIGVDEKRLEEAALEEFDGLRRFLPANELGDEMAEGKFFDEFAKVIREALKLHRIFLKSRAYFYIDWVDISEDQTSVAYNPEHHEAEVWEKSLDDTSVVWFNIAPSLMKVGDSNGNDYKQCTRLIKATVICD
ncbi:hypothetical protein K4K54_002425 [Colletotrichum sp. SAR 10_86]|nr:hypothetical protein K4K54_002425 [Colletotrichum sp. SAR 10_86]